MEFRDKLLSSELRHMTELVNMLSCELVILQDFLKEEFGSRYSRFRSRHALAFEGGKSEERRNIPLRTPPAARSGPCNNLRRNISDARKVAQSQSQSQDLDRTKNISHDDLDTDPIATDPNPGLLDTADPSVSVAHLATSVTEEAVGIGSETTSLEEKASSFVYENEDYDENFSDFSSDNSESKDKTWNASSDRDSSSGRKRRCDIWNKFDHEKLPNGKTVVKCRTCHSEVSGVPKRMENHYRKCCLNETVNVPRLPRSVSSKRSYRCNSMVWAHFDKVSSPDGRTIVICKYCSSRVSNHSTRMARHLQNCAKSPVCDPTQMEGDTLLDDSNTYD